MGAFHAMNAISQRIKEALDHCRISCKPVDHDDVHAVLSRAKVKYEESAFRKIADISNEDDVEDVRNIFRKMLPESEIVTVIWAADRFGIRMSFEDWIQFYEELWYPSSDDVFVVSESMGKIILLDHEEIIYINEIVRPVSSPAKDGRMTDGNGIQKTAPGFSIWPFVIASALISFLCSRGKDGMLLGALLGFGMLGIVYWMTLWHKGLGRSNLFVLDFFLLELAAVGAMIPGTQLDEMATMLYFIIPVLVLIVVIVGSFIAWVRLKTIGGKKQTA